MKSSLFLFSIMLILVSACTQKLPAPEFYDKPAYYDRETNTIQELERSKYQTLVKNLPPGMFGYYLDNPTSSVQLPQSDSVSFVIKVETGTDPSSVTDLVSFDVIDQKLARWGLDNRRVTLRTPNTRQFERKVDYQVSKLDEEVYLLTVHHLPSGEYFFRTKEFMYAFGIAQSN